MSPLTCPAWFGRSSPVGSAQFSRISGDITQASSARAAVKTIRKWENKRFQAEPNWPEVWTRAEYDRDLRTDTHALARFCYLFVFNITQLIVYKHPVSTEWRKRDRRGETPNFLIGCSNCVSPAQRGRLAGSIKTQRDLKIRGTN
ncbi:hypothetical protein J6590_018603 [Homalodisca vitripennis]|nr:hypothetical protein J6590_018603 [Homalodisca vitripennis]